MGRVGGRLDGLDATDRSLVSDAAVLGQSFTMAGLSAVSGQDEAELLLRLRTLVRLGILSASRLRNNRRISVEVMRRVERELDLEESRLEV